MSSPSLTVHARQSTASYAPIVNLDTNDHSDDEKNPQQNIVSSAHRSKVLRLCAVLMCIILGFGGGGLLVRQKIDSKSLAPTTACTDPVIRREWRDLSDVEKGDYIAAVQCLRNSPSRLGLNQTLYDDFPYVHSRNGEACEQQMHWQSRVLLTHLKAHGTAAFLPWHRYFIHVYEKALREQCAYSGHLMYVQDLELQTGDG